MPENRPAIPAEIKRKVFIESGHLCAVCGAANPLELAHIVAWHKCKEHKAENLICLCASCHARADKAPWDEKTLREYKQRPWVARNYKNATSPEPKAEVELVLNMEPDQVDEPRRMLLLILLAYVLNISMDRIRIISVRKSNSITVTVELPAESASQLLDAFMNEDAELLAGLAPFRPISISISKVKQSREDFYGYLRKRITPLVNWGALLAAVLTFLAGVYTAGLMDTFFKLREKNQTVIEGIIALLNIGLAGIVLLDIKLIRPVKAVDANTPASNSFKQLLFGWQWLWFTWILFYFCLAAKWLPISIFSQEITAILEPVSHFLNMSNGFFFYYLFFVLDQPSVRTDAKPYRARPFRRNCILTYLAGIILFLIFTATYYKFAGFEKLKIGELWSKLLPAYIAVGMAFLFGRLDSHYLKLPRVILAPLYLYAIIQLFWESSTYTDEKFRPDRVAIFSLAFILKLVLFLNLSKLIRHEGFRKYFVVAEKGLRGS